MQFHDYTTMKPAWYRGSTSDFIEEFLQTPTLNSISTAPSGQSHLLACDAIETERAPMELSWLRHDRPFYNVYPIAVDLCQKTQLNMKWGDILFPTKNLLLRFAKGHEPLGISSALLRVPSTQRISTQLKIHRTRHALASAISAFKLGGVIQVIEQGRVVPRVWVYGSEDDIREEVIADSVACGQGKNTEVLSSPGDERDMMNFLIRILAFIGLLARGNDLITPAILSKDREEYDATTDEARKRWLEDRAARRQGRGFDIGRSLEIERATSPHWRQPHLALFHTGPGRNVPVLKLRSGCVVIPKDMSQVPTGYMGEESLGEQHEDRTPAYRPSVPWGLRFDIMRRDGHRCRLCGLTADDGVRLEVDHITPVAKGGKTTKENLWLLCKPCNGGKSDKDLFLAIEKNTQMVRKEVASGI